MGDAAPFAEAMQFWSELPPGLIFFGACDPSLGKAGAGRDPSALLVGGLERESMRLYVVAADIKKRHPDRIIQDLIALQRQWHCVLWTVEAVQFQEFFAEVLVREAARQGLPLPVSPVKNCTDKNLRIESLHPYFCQGRILLRPDQRALVDQLRHFPLADHDDGPDALEMLWRAASQGYVSLRDAFVRVPRARSPFESVPQDDAPMTDDPLENGWI